MVATLGESLFYRLPDGVWANSSIQPRNEADMNTLIEDLVEVGQETAQPASVVRWLGTPHGGGKT